MIRIGRMTDYGIVLLSSFARQGEGAGLTARDLSGEAQLPLPTVSKLLKTLCKADLLTSQRGVNGGYRLSRHPSQISVAEVIEVLEGPIAITDCAGDTPDVCTLEGMCPVKGNWRRISDTVRTALEGLSLNDMIRPAVSNNSPTSSVGNETQAGGPNEVCHP